VGVRDVAEAVGLVTAPAAGLAALGLYFGWKRTQTYAAYFGIDNSVLGFSVQEYTLRSSTSVYRIILSGVGLGLAALFMHRTIVYNLAPRERRAAGMAVAVAGSFLLLTWARSPVNQLLGGWSPVLEATSATVIGVVAAAMSRFRRRSDSPIVRSAAGALVLAMLLVVLDAAAVPTHAAVIAAPYVATHTVLAFGVTLLIYAFFVLNPGGTSTWSRTPMWMRTLSIVFTALLVAAGLFAATDEYAESVGTSEAELTAARLEGRRGVIVYSKEDLGLPTSVSCRTLGNAVAFHYRCEGLRLFVRTQNGVLVLPATWSRFDGIDADDRVIFIRDSDSVRLEFTPGPSDFPYQSR
jgi:hypothetical protein